MNGRRRTFRFALCSAILIATTAFATPAMVLHGLRPEVAHHHSGHHSTPVQHHHGLEDCCDQCWVSCSTPLATPACVVLPVAVSATVEVAAPLGAGIAALPAALLRLPFPIGPPALQA